MSTPHGRAQSYLWDACRGTKQPYSNVAADAADISKNLGSGSGNWPIQIAAGAAINREPQGQDLGPFLRGENGWGLNGNEHGSPIYESWNVASILALLAKGPSEYRPDARRWLRAEVAKYCLSFRRRRPDRSILYVENEGLYTPMDPSGSWGLSTEPPDGWRYATDGSFGSRLYAVMPGSRQAQRFNSSDATRPQESPINFDRNQCAPLFAWALDYAERRFPTGGIRTQQGWGWPVAILELCWGTKFESRVDPERFGLVTEIVSTFRDFLDGGRADPSVLLPYLAGYGATSGQEQCWVGLANGEVASWINKTIHGSTTGIPLAWTEGGNVHLWSPQSTHRDSGGARCVAHGEGRFRVEADQGGKGHLRQPPVRREVELYHPNKVLWEVAWDAQGFRLVGEGQPPPGGGPTPPQPEPPPGQQVPRPPEIDESIDASGRAMAHYPTGSTVWAMIGNLAETLNRLGGQLNTGTGQRQLSPEEVPELVVQACESNLALARKL